MYTSLFSITNIIIAITAIVSFSAFNNQKVTDDLIFNPPAIDRRKQWYRFLTCALIHADIAHLGFNMISLYMFGDSVEKYFEVLFGAKGALLYIIMYVLSQFLCLLPTYLKNKDNYYYRSLGASGAVSAIIFAGIALSPMQKIYGIPGFIFGFIYLGVTAYLDRKGDGNINHSAHMFGALAGIGLLLIFGFAMSPYNLVENFIEQVKGFGQ
jgi:membrane associated rhomboid family serine protease